jgi:integrase
MLAKRPLTDRGIAALKPPAKGKRMLVWDALVPGLAVRVTDTGARSFVLVARYPGSVNPAARTIAKVGAIPLAEARRQAQTWLGALRAGFDPAKPPGPEGPSPQDTFGAIAEEFLGRDGGRLRSVDWIRTTLTRLVLPDLGPRPITSIRRTDVVRLLDRIEDQSGPVMANRTLAMIRRVMNWYATRADDFRTPIVRGMARAEVARDRVLSDDELRAIWRASGEAGTFGAYIWFLLLTAARRNEARMMTWSEIVDGVWTLPASRNKSGVELVRPLSGAAQALLAGMPRVGEFVFSTARGGPLELIHAKAALVGASGTGGWTLHDLRRTARSLMSRASVPSDHAERCLGHVIGGVRGVYDRHAYRDEMLLAYEKLATLIGQIVDPRENVIAIRGQR